MSALAGTVRTKINTSDRIVSDALHAGKVTALGGFALNVISSRISTLHGGGLRFGGGGIGKMR